LPKIKVNYLLLLAIRYNVQPDIKNCSQHYMPYCMYKVNHNISINYVYFVREYSVKEDIELLYIIGIILILRKTDTMLQSLDLQFSLHGESWAMIFK
jgi:hypothetical protein